MTILFRTHARTIESGREAGCEWLSRQGVDPKRVCAFAIEAPATDGPDAFHVLHLASYTDPVDLDPATGEPRLAYASRQISDLSIPDVRERVPS